MAGTNKRLTHEQYTVGWVCALPKEMIAAIAMLDEEHPTLPKPSGDANTYTLGRIGDHNVVIACLPMGEIGNNSSATVATRMTSTFRSIKFGLMVGIGGGVPKTVRLGDVVVSTPGDEYGGVVQWDFGKTEQGGTFKRTGALNGPPSTLRTALAKLKATHDMQGPRIPELLEDLAKKWPRLVPKYTRSEALEDILFKSDYNHVEEADNTDEEEDEEEDECGSCIHCDRSRTIRRKPRDMRVHYGLIASGNQVIKDAVFRHEINKRLGGKVLCFEMEAAGLMNDFPCIVIRGICDYADSHKNKAWQEHAAAVAAAMAKELLLVVPVQEVSELPTVSSILKYVEETREDVASMKESIDTAEHRAVLRWLSNIDQSSNHHNACSKHTPATGDWFLNGENYRRWTEDENSVLHLCGILGSGKTVISSVIISNLLKTYDCDHDVSVAYFYFDFSDNQKQTVDGCLRSILRQLSARQLPNAVKALYSQAEGLQTPPSLHSVLCLLKEVLTQTQRTFLVIDALDECAEVKTLMEKLMTITAWKIPGLHLLATSRKDSDIEQAMGGISARVITLDRAVVQKDIRTYLTQRLDTLSERWSRQERESIRDAILAQSQGMFLLAECQLREIELCYSSRDLRSTLATLPKTLNKTFERTLLRVPLSHRKAAQRLLQWLVCSLRPLLIEEAAEIFAFDFDTTPKFDPEKRLRVQHDILSICPGLIAFTLERTEHLKDQTPRAHVKFAHSAIKEYLVSADIQAGPLDQYAVQVQVGNEKIAESCITYLLQLNEAKSVTSSTCEKLPLAQYAAEYWTEHYHLAGRSPDSKLHQLMEQMFGSETKAYFNWLSIYDHDQPWRSREGLGNNLYSDLIPSQIYIAALTGLEGIVRSILGDGVDVKIVEGFYGNALHAAASRGHVQVVELLLEHGMHVDTHGLYGTTLETAAYEGQVEVSRLLLEKGANVNAKGEEFGNALQAAVYGNHPQVVQVLLEKGADITTPGIGYADILHTISSFGHVQILQLLLEKCSVDPLSKSYDRALQSAIDQGHTQILEILKQNGPTVDSRKELYGSAIHAAAAEGCIRIVELLLDNGAHIDAMDEDHGTALYIASSRGDTQLTELLLNRGADVNIQTTNGMALHAASGIGHFQVVRMLLIKGADVNAQGGYFGTALQAACYKGSIEIVRHLLESGAHVNTFGGEYGSPLQAASCAPFAQIGMVQLLLNHGADVSALGGKHNSALEAALSENNGQIANLLDEHGAQSNAKADGGGPEYRFEPQQSDVFIAITGQKGVGKTTFISLLADVTHTVSPPFEPGGITIYLCKYSHFVNIWLLETPASDIHNLNTIALHRFVSRFDQSFSWKITLNGVIYLRSILEVARRYTPGNRHIRSIEQSELRNWNSLPSLCAKEDLGATILATTRWEEIDLDVGERGEKELMTSYYCSTMIRSGLRVQRHQNNVDSALLLIDMVVPGCVAMKKGAVTIQEKITMEVESALCKERALWSKKMEEALAEKDVEFDQRITEALVKFNERLKPLEEWYNVGPKRRLQQLEADKLLAEAHIKKERELEALRLELDPVRSRAPLTKRILDATLM